MSTELEQLSTVPVHRMLVPVHQSWALNTFFVFKY